jgi:hypothetical protein
VNIDDVSFGHRKRAPLTKKTQCDSGTIGRCLCGVTVAASSIFRRFCATRAATIGFFFAMLQKDHATECQLPVGGIAIPPMA